MVKIVLQDINTFQNSEQQISTKQKTLPAAGGFYLERT